MSKTSSCGKFDDDVYAEVIKVVDLFVYAYRI